MERKKASDFDQELLNIFDQYVHGQIDRRGFLDRAAKFAVGGVTADDAARRAEPELRRGPAGAEGRRAHQDGIGRVPVAAGLEQDARLSRAAGDRLRQAARHPRRPREPRPQPAHRGHRAAAGARQLHGVRARRARAARRLSRRRGQGARAVPEARPGQDARGLRRRGGLLEESAGLHRQDRRRRLLLRRRHRQHAGDAPARSRGRRAVLRQSADAPRTPRRSRRRC